MSFGWALNRDNGPLSNNAPITRRAFPRRMVRAVRCSEGDLIDFSCRGARLFRRLTWRPGTRRTLRLRAGDIDVTVQAVGVWARREGFLCHVVGVAFCAVSPEQSEAIAEIFRHHGLTPILARPA